MGPGATKVNFFEPPSEADGIHHVLNVGPLQFGINCVGKPTGTEEIKLGTFLTIPGPETLLFIVPTENLKTSSYTQITGSIANAGSPSTVAAKEGLTAFLNVVVAGPNGVPYWLWVYYGAATETVSNVSTLTTSQQRGCWFMAEEV
jgi:hypothetical protein